MRDIKLYGRTDMIDLEKQNKLYGSLGIEEPVKIIDKIETGKGYVILTECVKDKFKQFKLLGNSVQQETPSPEFPQEIKNAGKWNEEKQKYEVDVQVTGKNLFNISDLKMGKVREDGYIDSGYKNYRTIVLDIKINGNYLIRFKKNTDYDRLYITAKYFEGQFSTPYLNVYTEQNAYITLKKGINILSFKAIKNDSENTFTGDSEIMISYVKDIEYEPYREPQTVKLYLDQQLRGIGKRKDEVTKNGVVRRVYEQNIKKEQVSMNEYNWITKIFRCYITNEKKLDSSENYILMSNISKKFNIYRGNNVIYWVISEEDIKSIGVTEKDSREMAFEKIKTFVNNNNIVVQYPVEEPIIEPLSEENKLALESLHTNEGTTVIAVDGGEAEAGIEVIYKSYGNNVRNEKYV